jgi:hypothetical protein
MVPASPMVPVKRARPSKTVGCFTTNKPRNINHHAPDSLLVQAASCLKISDDGQGRIAARLSSRRSAIIFPDVVVLGKVLRAIGLHLIKVLHLIGGKPFVHRMVQNCIVLDMP